MVYSKTFSDTQAWTSSATVVTKAGAPGWECWPSSHVCFGSHSGPIRSTWRSGSVSQEVGKGSLAVGGLYLDPASFWPEGATWEPVGRGAVKKGRQKYQLILDGLMHRVPYLRAVSALKASSAYFAYMWTRQTNGDPLNWTETLQEAFSVQYAFSPHHGLVKLTHYEKELQVHLTKYV